MILYGGPRRGGELHALYEKVKTQKQLIEEYKQRIRELEAIQDAAQAEERRICVEMLNDVRAKLERAVLAREERAATNPARWIYTQLDRGVSRSCSYSCVISCPICGATYPRLDGVDFAFCPNSGKPIVK